MLNDAAWFVLRTFKVSNLYSVSTATMKVGQVVVEPAAICSLTPFSAIFYTISTFLHKETRKHLPRKHLPTSNFPTFRHSKVCIVEVLHSGILLEI